MHLYEDIVVIFFLYLGAAFLLVWLHSTAVLFALDMIHCHLEDSNAHRINYKVTDVTVLEL